MSLLHPRMLPRGALTVALAFLVLSAEAGEIDAFRFDGVWTCRSRTDGAVFTWRVSRDLAGGWLTGEGIEGGRAQSLDVWAHDPDGRLQKRRQFTPRGALIELDVTERGDETLGLEGAMTYRDGRRVPVRERIRFLNDDGFAAAWDLDEGEGWRTVVDEVCQRAAGKPKSP